jgi:predicted AAA+ superfamily ATPase
LDLARRADFYTIHPLNYKEYLNFFHQISIPDFTLEEILNNHEKISLEYANLHKELRFEDFIKRGQYPYVKKLHNDVYILKMKNLFDKIVIDDLPVFINLQTDSLDKIKRLLYFVANSTPSELSFS